MASPSHCNKCNQQTREPHFLRCDHFFCYRCVVTLYNEHVITMKMQTQKQGPTQFPCGVPGCDTMTPVPLGGLRNLPKSCQLTGAMAELSLDSVKKTHTGAKQYGGYRVKWRKTGNEIIRNLAMMGDGSCLVVTAAGVTQRPDGILEASSCTLQRLSPEGKPTDLPFPCFATKPKAVTINQSYTTVVVVDDKGKSVDQVSVYSKQGDSWGYSSFISRRGIQATAITDDGCIVCTARKGLQWTLVLMSGTGQEEWTRSLPEGGYRTYICVSKDLVIASSVNNDTVTVISRQGDLVHTLPSGLISRPSGVTRDSTGRLVIADRANKSISLFTPEGHFIKTLIKCQGFPQHISLSQDRFLLVCELTDNKDDLCLYELH